MKLLLSDNKFNQEELLLYSLLAIVLLTTTVFLGIYFIWVPFWPARIVHIVYFIYHIYLVTLLKQKRYLFVKVSILLTNIVQLAFATFLWFPLTTQYALFYFLLPMGSFTIMNLVNKKERYFAFAITSTSFLFFFLNGFLRINFAMFEPSDTAIKAISLLTTTSTIGILALYFYLHALFLTQKRVELEHQASTDSLTNICNRRHFYHLSKSVFESSQKNGDPFSLLLLDIDYFKKVNDTYGHDVGDEVLKEICQNIKQVIPEDDIFARHGGEEFSILLKGTDVEAGIEIADQIRKSVENLEVVCKSATIQVTISIGVVQFSKAFETFDELIIYADKALYTAKEKGRNCIHFKPSFNK